MARNRIVNKLKSRIPYLGNNQALKNHIANALRNAGDLSVVIRNIDAIPKENMDSLTKTGLEKFKTEIIPEIRQIIKETQGEAAEQGSKLEQAEAKQEVVKGDGWTMRDGGEAKTDYVIKTDLAPNVRDLSKITTDEITADLEYLAGKHPEIFDKPSDVFKLIKEIKENPTHFFTNYRLDYALIVKRLEDNKIGKLAVDKQSGEAKHATRVKDKDLKRLDRVSKEKSENAGIIQTFTRPGSKLENQGLGYQYESIISQKGNLVNEKEAKRASEDALHSHTDTKPAGALTLGQDARLARFNDSIIPQHSAKDETAIKTHVNPHAGAGLAGGTLSAKDENGNFDAEKFAKGFIYGLFGSKVTAATLKKTNPKLYDQIVNIGKDKAGKEKISSFVNKLKQDELGKLLQKTITNKDLSTKTKIEIIEAAKKRFTKETPKSLNGQSEAQMIVKDKDQKEKRGIYNVAYNDKKSTIIYKDLEAIENAIKFEKGFENKVTKKGFGALHIEKHLNEKNAGWVTQQEYLNMGEVVRKGKLNTDKYGRRSYEYYKNGIRFRVAIGYMGKGKDRVISFFSDRKPKK